MTGDILEINLFNRIIFFCFLGVNAIKVRDNFLHGRLNGPFGFHNILFCTWMREINNKKIEKGDFFKVQADEKVILQSLSASKVFVIKSPIKTGYLTYAEKRFV